MDRFWAHFSGLEDPRTGNAQRHDLLEILLIALCAMLCGAESCVDMALFGRSKEGLLRQFLKLEQGIPSHDTFSRIFRLLRPEPFHACFVEFMAAFAQAHGGVVAIDGKTLRRSFDRAAAASPLHLVSAWACEQRLVLGQMKVKTASNEIEAVPRLLAMLNLEDTVVTLDAMHCQRTTARHVLDQGGHYVLALKGNQGQLYEDVRLLFDDPEAEPDDVTGTVEGDHGRIETRRAAVLTDIDWLRTAHDWPGLAAIGKVTATREIDGAQTTAMRYYLLSRPMSAAQLAHSVRAHWTIENQLHWVLDVVMNEDQARARKDHAPENLALLRRLALSIIKKDSQNGSNRGKFKRAGWDDAYLLKLIAQI